MAEQIRTNEPQDWHDAQRLITLLTEQCDLYRRLRALSEQQRTLITGDRPEMLLSILRERQALVAALARLNDQLSPFRRNWEQVRAALAPAERDQADRLLEEINRLLQVILRTDQQDTALLSARRQAVSGELATLSGGQSVNAAYARQSAGDEGLGAADVTG